MIEFNRNPLTTHPHKLLREPKTTVRAHDAQASDMAMKYPIRRFLLHLCQDVADYFGGVVRRAWGSGHVDSDVGESRP